ncbi:conserved hypothetical protein, partial [Ricinus communis]
MRSGIKPARARSSLSGNIASALSEAYSRHRRFAGIMMTDARFMTSMTLGDPLHAWAWNWRQTTAIRRLARFLARLRAFVAQAKAVDYAILTAMAEPTANAAPSQRAISSPDETMRRFQRTIIPHLDAAYNFARFLCRDADAAQDIVQEAYLRAYRGFGGFRDGDARAWTFTI